MRRKRCFRSGLRPALLAAALLALATGPTVAEPIATGQFVGKSRHVASGTVTVSRSAGGTVVTLESDFAFDGAPDPKLGFGSNGYDPKTKFSELKANSGKQSYQVPAGIDAANYGQIWIWCEKYNVPLGLAELK